MEGYFEDFIPGAGHSPVDASFKIRVKTAVPVWADTDPWLVNGGSEYTSSYVVSGAWALKDPKTDDSITTIRLYGGLDVAWAKTMKLCEPDTPEDADIPVAKALWIKMPTDRVWNQIKLRALKDEKVPEKRTLTTEIGDVCLNNNTITQAQSITIDLIVPSMIVKTHSLEIMSMHTPWDVNKLTCQCENEDIIQSDICLVANINEGHDLAVVLVEDKKPQTKAVDYDLSFTTAQFKAKHPDDMPEAIIKVFGKNKAGKWSN